MVKEQKDFVYPDIRIIDKKYNIITKLKIIWYIIIYPIAGIMLLVLLFDIYTGKVYEIGPTIPHQAYIVVLVVIMHIMYRMMNGDI